jgi:hypothetical protein
MDYDNAGRELFYAAIGTQPTGCANARPMTGSAKQSMAATKRRWIASLGSQ